MANSDTRGVRHVKCPRCQSVLQEPGVPVYQCGGCGATLRAKNRSGESPSRGSLPSQSRPLGSGDVASTSSRSSTPTPDARSSGQQATDITSRRESGDLVSARRHGSGDVASTSRTPEATRSSRQQATGTTSRCASADLVSGSRHGSGDVASTSSPPDATRSSRQHATSGTTSRRESGDLVSSRRPGSGDVASTSSTPDATSGGRQEGTDTAIQRESSDLSSARNQMPLIERKEEHEQSTNRGVHHSSEFPSQRYAGAAERSAISPSFSVSQNRGSKDATSELQGDAEKRSKSQVESPDAARKTHSGDQAAVQPLQVRVREEPAPKPAQVAEPQPSRIRDAAPVAGGKAPSPPRHDLQAEDLAPLRQKILKTVDELRGDLSELFRKSPDLNPTTTTRARPPRLPNKQEGHVPRGAAASTFPARGARRHAAAGADHRAARAMKPGQVIAAAPPPPPPRGLPSRRYRRCRADPCFDNNVQQPRPCHHGGCRHSSKPECSSCRGHCCRPVRAAQEPSAAARKPPPAAAANKRRPPPRHHCRPVLKGAPFIICSSCFKLVQVPADFAVATNRLLKLRCGACSAVLSYSYRDPARKKSVDEFSADGSDQVRGGGAKGYGVDDPFAPFVDAFGLSSYSTTEDDEQTPPLHVSRNTSFDTVDGAKAVGGRLHRLMGYGSASELLLRHSPDLCESFGERTTTPDYDRKGKGVCVDDDEDDGGLDDSDDEDDSGVLKRSAARGAVWPLPGQGAIRIKS